MLNATVIPAPRVQLIDPRTGDVSREWYRWFTNVFTRIGGGTTDITITDVYDNLTEQHFMLMGA